MYEKDVMENCANCWYDRKCSIEQDGRKEEDNMKETPKIPKATAKRLPVYYRYVRSLSEQGIDKFSSTDLSEAVHVDSATIRRDFSYFGELGKRGYGYDVESILHFFVHILNEDRLMNVAVVGVGNLGSAILKFRFHNTKNIRISSAFDIRPEIIGRIIDGFPVYSMDDLKEQVEQQRLEIAILTVSSEQAQKATDQLVDAGIKGILNFTPVRLIVPESVKVQSVDLTTELQTLIYFVKNAENNTDE